MGWATLWANLPQTNMVDEWKVLNPRLDKETGPGLPDGLFSNQKSQWGKFIRVLQWKMLLYFMDTWVHLTFFWYIL
jgi:hypothetical protein